MIKCNHCGKDVSEYAQVCPNCGQKPNIGENIVDKKIKPKFVVSIGNKIAIISAVVALIVSAFVFACAVNAYRAIRGDSVTGIGGIFFEKYIVEGMFKPIVIAMICSGVAMGIFIIIVALCLIYCFKKNKKSNS